MNSFHKKAKLFSMLVLTLALSLHGCANSTRSEKLGFIDRSGSLVIDLDKYVDPWVSNIFAFKKKPRPKKVAMGLGDFSSGMAPIYFYKTSNAASFLNEQGQIVGEYEQSEPFSEGLAAVLKKTSNGDRWGYIDANGDFVVKPVYTSAKEFSQGLAAVSLEDKWGYVDVKGKLLIQPEFHSGEPFSDGLAAVRTHGKMGCIDRTGKFVIQPIYDKVYSSSCGITVAENKINSDGKQGSRLPANQFYFDKNGKLLFDRESQTVDWRYFAILEGFGAARKVAGGSFKPLGISATPSFSEDLAVVQVGAKFGYMDRSGIIVIAPIFDYAFNFSDGLAIVYKDEDKGLLAYIDRKGQLVTPFKFKYAQPFSEGLAVVSEQDDPLFGYIKKTGEYAIRPQYNSASSFKEGKARVGSFTVYL